MFADKFDWLEIERPNVFCFKITKANRLFVQYKFEEIVSFKSNENVFFEIVKADYTKNFREQKGEKFFFKLK